MSNPTCFVMIPFATPYRKAVEAAIREAVTHCELDCILADNSHVGEIPQTIRNEIRRAVVCIADVTENNANVAYELGIADTLDKAVVLISQDPTKTQFDIRHRHMIHYSLKTKGVRSLTQELETILRQISKRELLRMMLTPPDLPHKEGPFIIAANPLSWREGKRREGGFPKLTRTQVEYVGVRSLLLEFGALHLSENEPELLNPNDYLDDVVKEAMNLYCLASPKANRWTGLLLDEFNKNWIPAFEFKGDPNSNLRDVGVQVWKEGQVYEPLPPTYWHDFGLIIRGPNPFPLRKDWMFTILAGRRGTGTEAACRAAVDWKLLAEINKTCDLSSFKKPWYAVVSMKRHESTIEADLESLRVIDAGHFSPRPHHQPFPPRGGVEGDPRSRM